MTNLEKNFELLEVNETIIEMWDDGYCVPAPVLYSQYDIERIREVEYEQERICYYAYNDFYIDEDCYVIVMLTMKYNQDAPSLENNNEVEAYLMYEDENRNHFAKVRLNSNTNCLEVVI